MIGSMDMEKLDKYLCSICGKETYRVYYEGSMKIVEIRKETYRKYIDGILTIVEIGGLDFKLHRCEKQNVLF